MGLQVHSQPGGFGAAVTGVDIANPLNTRTTTRLRNIWLDHQVLSFPGQQMDHPALERFARAFGDFGVLVLSGLAMSTPVTAAPNPG